MRVKGGDFLTLAEHLTLNHDATFTVGEILDFINGGRSNTNALGRSTLQYWLRQLRWHEALRPVNEGYVVELGNLLNLLAAQRKVQLTPAAEVRVDCEPATLSRRLKRANVSHALGILSAAEAWGAPPTKHPAHLYLPRGDITSVTEELTEGDFEVQIFAENVEGMEDLHIKMQNGLSLTCPFVTLLDCLGHPRGAQHARHMRLDLNEWESTS